MAALMITGNVHFLRLKKTGSRRIVYPVQEMGEASKDGMIPSAEILSEDSRSFDFFEIEMINKATTATTLKMMPKFMF